MRPNFQFVNKKFFLIATTIELYLYKQGLIQQVPVFEIALARGHAVMTPFFEKLVPEDFYDRMERRQEQVRGIQEMTLAVMRIIMKDGKARKKDMSDPVPYDHFNEIEDLSAAFTDLSSELAAWVEARGLFKK